MKIKILSTATFCIGAFFLSLSIAPAASIYKADVPDNLNLDSSWTGGVAPGASDVAVWDNTVQTNTTSSLGAPLSWSGIQILDPAAPITIAADGNALTLGASGIDMSQATNGLTLDNDLDLGASQTWTVANSQKLTVAGIVSGASALTLTGGGTVELSGNNTYSGGTILNGGIVEPDNAFCFGAAAANVTNNSDYFLFDIFPNGGVIANRNYVNGTATIDMFNRSVSVVLDGAWAGNGTIQVTNLASGATLTLGGNGTGGDMNSFTGAVVVADTNSDGNASAGSIRFNNGGSSHNVGSANAIFNLGQGNVQFTEKNGNVTTYFGALIGGPNTELAKNENYVIGGLNLDTTFAGTIQSSSSLNKTGTGTFTLTGNNPYTGTTTISDGTLQIGDGITTGAGTLGTGSVVNNATLTFNRPDDIEVDNAISGSGTTVKENANILTYNGADSSFGELAINQGTVALGSAGSISSTIFVADGADFDVSQNPSFALGSTLAGFGAVLGNLTASGGTISPGDVGAAGTLTFSNDLTEAGNVNNQMELSTPGSTNDLINVAGNLNLSGVNNIVISAFGGGMIPNGTYPLINYSGSLSGTLDNLSVAVVGATATLTNPPNQIAIIISPPARSVTNLTWVGDGAANDWDVNTSTNWVSGTTQFTFLTGDSVFFNDQGAANSTINVANSVLPAAVTVDASSDYTFTGIGSIGGSTGLTKTNSGTLTIDETNSYAGPTVISGGVLQVFSVADAGLPSPIGAGSGESSNLVFYNSTFRYLSPDSPEMNRNATLAGSGATIDITNSSANFTESGSFDGSGALTKTGSGTLTLDADSAYSGGTVISNGVLALGSNGANSSGSQSGVGSTTNPVTFYGGTLQLYGYNGSTSPTYNSFYNPLVVPAGQTGTLDLFCRASGLYSSLTGGGTLNLIINYVRDDLVGDWSGFTGVINVTPKPSGQGDEMRLHNSYGYANATINLNDGVLMDSLVSDATINIGELDGTEGALIGTGNSSSPNPTWCIGWKNTSSVYSGAITNDGVTSLTKVGTGTLTFNNSGAIATITIDGSGDTITNYSFTSDNISYSGATTISNGVLALVCPMGLTHSSAITLASPAAVLDASQMGYISNQYDSDGVTLTNQLLVTNGVFEVVSGQVLAGVGTIQASNVLADDGSTVNVGLPTGTLAASGGVELGGAVNININANSAPNSGEISAASITVDPTATLTVNNLGPEIGATFQLFNHAVNFTQPVTLPTLTGTNSWVNNLATDGSITLIAPPPAIVNTTPTNIVASVSGGNLTLSWPADHTGWHLQMQTNSLSVGLNTNWVNVPGAELTNQVTIPINPTNGAAFFRMSY